MPELIASTEPGSISKAHYTWKDSPSYWNGTQQGFFNLDAWVTIDDLEQPGRYSWAHHFQFINGFAGYINLGHGSEDLGFGPDGERRHGPEEKYASFMIRAAKGAEAGQGGRTNDIIFGPTLPLFHDGREDNIGKFCQIPFDWQPGREYRLRVWEIMDARRPDQDEWWGAWVMDCQSGTETFIGKLLLPGNWKWLSSTSHWSIDYDGVVSGSVNQQETACDGTPYAKTSFGTPRMDNATTGPESLRLETTGECGPNASIQLVAGSSTECQAETGLSRKPQPV